MDVVKPIQEENRQKNDFPYYGDAGRMTFDFWGCLPPFMFFVALPDPFEGVGGLENQ